MVAYGAPVASDDTRNFWQRPVPPASAAQRVPRVPSLWHAAARRAPHRTGDGSRPSRDRWTVLGLCSDHRHLSALRRTRVGPARPEAFPDLRLAGLCPVERGLWSRDRGRSVCISPRSRRVWERVSPGLPLCPSCRIWRPATVAGENTDGSKKWLFAAPSWDLSWDSVCSRSTGRRRNRRVADARRRVAPALPCVCSCYVGRCRDRVAEDPGDPRSTREP